MSIAPSSDHRATDVSYSVGIIVVGCCQLTVLWLSVQYCVTKFESAGLGMMANVCIEFHACFCHPVSLSDDMVTVVFHSVGDGWDLCVDFTLEHKFCWRCLCGAVWSRAVLTEECVECLLPWEALGV